MKMLRNTAIGAAVALSAAMSFTPAMAEEVKIAISSTLETLDPHNSTANSVASAADGIFERLIEFDRDMKLVPGLATAWEASEDATVFTFKLREGVKFHDGTPFNAEAVKANIDRLADQSNNLKRNSMFRVVSSTEVVDEHTFRMTLGSPFGAMLATIAHPSIVMHSPKALAEMGNDVGKHPVGTGPFKFEGHVPGDYLNMTRFEEHWGDSDSNVDEVTLLTVRESATSVAMLKSEEVQYVFPLPAELHKNISNDDTFQVQEIPGITVWTASMNLNLEPFKDARVRKAFNLAVDKNAFLQVVYAGHGRAADSPIAPNTAFYSQQEAYPFDLEQARALMKEAGYEDGFEIEAWGRNNTNETRTLQFLQQQLSQINVKVKIFPLEAATRSAKLFGDVKPEDQQFGLAIGGWSPSTGDADWHIRPVYGTEAWIPKIFNLSFYSSPEVDAAIETALSSADQKIRGDAYAKAQSVIWNDVPAIFLGSENKMAAGDAKLDGVYPMPDGTFVYGNASLK